MGPKVSLLANARLPLRRHSVADSSNAPGFTHFRHTMLKYVDVYRCSDGGVLVGHHHNRPGPDNSARAPHMQPFPTVAGARHDQLCMEERAHPDAGVPCFVVPWALNPWTCILGTRNLWVISWPQQNHPEILAISTILTVGRWHWR